MPERRMKADHTECPDEKRCPVCDGLIDYMEVEEEEDEEVLSYSYLFAGPID